MSHREAQRDRKSNPTAFIEGLEARQMMSASVISVFSPTHYSETVMDVGLQSQLSSSVSNSFAAKRESGTSSTVAKVSGPAAAVFSNYGIPKPTTDNVLLAAMGAVNAAPSPAVVRATAANQAGRALSVSSVHSFAGRPPQKEQLRRISNAKGRLLLVEDDASTRRALTMILQKQGWNVTTAGTVAEGIHMLAMRPDHVIVDLMLPDGDGAQLLAHANASNLHPHMTVTTGVADSERLDRARQLGAEAVLRKPINLPELLKQLGN